ncbi:hypothetical protein RB201_35685 [Streptomyces sp. S1A(2023)]
MRRLVPSLGGASGGAENLAKSGSKLGPVMWGVGGALGLSVLPALGAVVPMAAGAGLALGTLTLGFAGVGEAAALAGEDKEEYAKALKKLSPEARDFTKELVKTKDEFSSFGKKIQAAMLPGFTKALKDAKPVIDIVGKGMTTMGKGFGDAAAGAGRLFKSGGFQKDLKTNLDLGMSFAREMTGGLGSLTRGLLDFGAKSGPTLRSFSTGLSGLLGKGGGGLVGMFKGLEPGIGGSAKLLDGLFGAVNRILPALGRLGGMAGKAFGPLFGELFEFSGKVTSALMDGLGGVIKWLSPVFKDLSFGVKSVTNILSILAPTVRDTASAIFGSFMPAFGEVDKAVGPLQRLSNTIKENKGAIQEFTRQGSSAMITVAGAVIEHMPTALAVFRMVTGGMVTAMGGVLHGAAATFGWIPGIGDKLKKADRSFNSFKDSYISGLKSAEAKTREFAAGALPKLEQGRLKMNINNWTSQIETAKAKLKTLPADKQAKVRAEISDLQRKIASARATLSSLHDKTVTVTTRHVVVGGQARTSGSHGSQLKYASGGPIDGPGTSTSDSVPIWASKGEFMVKAQSVAKYGVSFLKAVNDGTLNLRGAATASSSGGGGGLSGAGAEAGRGLSAGLRGSAADVDASARLMAAAVTSGVRAELGDRVAVEEDAGPDEGRRQGPDPGHDRREVEDQGDGRGSSPGYLGGVEGSQDQQGLRSGGPGHEGHEEAPDPGQCPGQARREDQGSKRVPVQPQDQRSAGGGARQPGAPGRGGVRVQYPGGTVAEAGEGPAVHPVRGVPREAGPVEVVAAAGHRDGPGRRVRLRVGAGRDEQVGAGCGHEDAGQPGLCGGRAVHARRGRSFRQREERGEGLPEGARLPAGRHREANAEDRQEHGQGDPQGPRHQVAQHRGRSVRRVLHQGRRQGRGRPTACPGTGDGCGRRADGGHAAGHRPACVRRGWCGWPGLQRLSRGGAGDGPGRGGP